MIWQGIIFDFNGVLWWDGALQEQSWGQFSVYLRGAPLTAEEVAVHVHGRNNRHSLEYLLGRSLATDELARLIEEKEVIYRRLCLEQGAGFCLSPGAVELLDWLASQDVPRTIATASGKANLDFFARHLDLERWFDLSRIAYDNGRLRGKPAPDLYLRAARNLGLPAGRCVVVEDSQSGIEAARLAGIGCIVALGPCTSHDELERRPGVALVVEDLAAPSLRQLLMREATIDRVRR